MSTTTTDTNPTNHADRWYLLGFVVANLAIKLALVNFNGGSYTDGIIQLQSADFPPHNKYFGVGLYPPLYADLTALLSFLGIGLETAGRVVSAIAGSFALVPIFYLTRLVFGRDAARIAALLFTVSPLIMRWSTHAMTDSLFLTLSASSLYFYVRTWTSLASESRSNTAIDWSLAWASAFGALATYTRYQGVLLVLPLGLALMMFLGRGAIPLRTLLFSLLWAAPAAFAGRRHGVHTGQFLDRTAGSLVPTLSAYWNTLESFVLISPYYFGYPIALLAIVGMALVSRGSIAVRPFAWIFGSWAMLLLVVHAAFGSFQYRYMMPALPAVLALAGHGAHQLYVAAKVRRLYPLYSAAMLMSLVYLALFATAVLVFQRPTLADQKQAAAFVKEHAGAGEPVFANERYGNFTELSCVKLSFWSGRKVELLYDAHTGRLRDLPGGSWVVLGNQYGGNQSVDVLGQQIRSRYTVQEIQPPFSARIVPLMDDIMVDPLFNQNPMGWVLRYTPQTFFTRVLHVVGPASGTGGH
ncbi:MAG: ArnT family glycosyltransferase [Candidatus Sumerlaeaceae bacterium]